MCHYGLRTFKWSLTFVCRPSVNTINWMSRYCHVYWYQQRIFPWPWAITPWSPGTIAFSLQVSAYGKRGYYARQHFTWAHGTPNLSLDITLTTSRIILNFHTFENVKKQWIKLFLYKHLFAKQKIKAVECMLILTKRH